MLPKCLSYTGFIMLRHNFSISNTFRNFIMNKCYHYCFCIYWDNHGFYNSFNLCKVLCIYTLCNMYLICIFWNILASLEWNQPEHNVWSFWWTLDFNLQACSWGYSLFCPVGLLLCTFLLLCCQTLGTGISDWTE